MKKTPKFIRGQTVLVYDKVRKIGKMQYNPDDHMFEYYIYPNVYPIGESEIMAMKEVNPNEAA